MSDLSDAFAPLVDAERGATPARAQLARRVNRRRRRRLVRGAGALVLVAAAVAGVIALVPGNNGAVRVTNNGTTTTSTSAPARHDAATAVADRALGWSVAVPAGWTAQQSRAVCNPGEIGIVVSPDPHAFTTAEGNAGCFDGSTGPLPGEVVVSLSRVAVASPNTPSTPFPRTIADVPPDLGNPAMHVVQIIEGSSEYLVRVVQPADASTATRQLVELILQSFSPIRQTITSSLIGEKASDLALPAVSGIAFNAAGDVFLADRTLNRVIVIDPAGFVIRVYGDGTQGFAGDGFNAADAELNTPLGIAVDPAGNLYIADSFNNRVRRVAPDGIITTFAGTGASASSPDGRLAAETAIQGPQDVLWDTITDSLYIAEGARVRRVTPDGIMHTVAGTGNPEIGYELRPDGLATETAICDPSGIAITSDRSLWIADDCDKSIARVGPDGRINKAPGFAFRLAAAPDGSVSAYFGRDGGINRVTPTAYAGLLQLDNQAPLSSCTHYTGVGDDSAALAWHGDTLYFANPSMSRVCALQPDGTIDTIVGG